jgi:hypothetical protein
MLGEQENIFTMISKILPYSKFQELFEGGAAIKQSRRIMESEVPETLKSIENLLLPLLGDGQMGEEYIIIGSIGKKQNPTDTSGDIDLGIDKGYISRKFRISEDQVLEFIFKRLGDELPGVLGFTPEMKLMKGINVISIGWPIAGKNFNSDTVQLDLIPILNMDWASFIFYSPDYRLRESKYKSAHRNWLFQAILSSLKEVESFDDNGDPETYYSYVLRLSDGIYKNKKTFKGATKRLKNPQTVAGHSQFITDSPREFLDLLFGGGVSPDDVKTFEQVWNLVKSPNFIHKDRFESIKEDLIRYLTNGNYEIPTELR